MGTSNGSTNGTASVPRISLVALTRKVVGEVEIESDNGPPRWVCVRAFDGQTWHLHQQMVTAEGGANVGVLYAIADRLLPDASESEVRRLTVEAVGQVIAVAAGTIEQVEQVAEARAEGNGRGRARGRKTPAASPAT